MIDAVAALREAGLKIGSATGYTDAMMEIVVPKAAELGYAPDHWVSADGTQGFGRPYPYMIFHNMQVLRLMDVRRVAKVGDTISDIKEGKNAGVFTVGVTEGSSQMGLSLAEFEALLPRRTGPRAPDGAVRRSFRPVPTRDRHDGRAARPCCWAERAHRPGHMPQRHGSQAYDLSLSLRLQATARENRLGCVLSSPRDNTHPK